MAMSMRGLNRKLAINSCEIRDTIKKIPASMSQVIYIYTPQENYATISSITDNNKNKRIIVR